MEFAIHLGFLVTMLISSKLSEYIPHAWILMAVGIVFCGVGGWGMLRYQQKKFLDA
jgi:hypothetical protein